MANVFRKLQVVVVADTADFAEAIIRLHRVRCTPEMLALAGVQFTQYLRDLP